MPTKTYAGQAVDVDAEGYLASPDAWTKEIGEAIAGELGVALTAQSWKVIDFVRADFRELGVTPGMRRITARTEVGTKDLYALFPKGPVKLIARIAGTPKPKSCL
jgi:dissimilatory sulfite reductase related protein